MPITLPDSIAAYVAAKNRHDVDASLAAFAEDAIVVDERHTHRGRAEIRAWLRDVIARYAMHTEPTACEQQGNVVKMLAQVSGTFPGSPVGLTFHVTLNGNRIARLECH